MRYYGQWSGNREGTPEDPRRCIVKVIPPGRSIISRQCAKERGYGTEPLAGLLCAFHAKEQRAGVHLYIPSDTGRAG